MAFIRASRTSNVIGNEVKVSRYIRTNPAPVALSSLTEGVFKIEKVITLAFSLNLLSIQFITPNSFRVDRQMVLVLYCKRYPKEFVSIQSRVIEIRVFASYLVAVIYRNGKCVSMLRLNRTLMRYVIVLGWRLVVTRVEVCLLQSDAEKDTQAYD